LEAGQDCNKSLHSLNVRATKNLARKNYILPSVPKDGRSFEKRRGSLVSSISTIAYDKELLIRLAWHLVKSLSGEL
jgi:hypothetical protein